MRDDLVFAYLAGVIDSDGFISAHRHRRGGVIYCAPLIGISGTSSEPHELARSIWGGSLFAYTPKNPSHRVQHQWQSVGVRAARAVRDISPFLRSKGHQAAIALEMWEMISSGMRRTDPALYNLAAVLSDMNLRNPPKKPIPAHLARREFPVPTYA